MIAEFWLKKLFLTLFNLRCLSLVYNTQMPTATALTDNYEPVYC